MTPDLCGTMEQVRTEIDRIDDALVALLVERWGYVDRAWQLKERPEDATVPWRIQQVIDQVRARCEGTDLPPALTEALWRQIIGWGIQYEQEKLSAKQAGEQP